MKLPRRTAWASLAELDQVCTWVYTDEYDLAAQTLAVERIHLPAQAKLAAWKAVTALPHALESLLALLTALLHDAHASAPSSSSLSPSSSSQTPLSQPRGAHALSVRQDYAAALIRLVNGLVDPLQVGAYARSIAAIAAQLGLPAWLVELRHAATHEDLPSLELLRDAARESMSWLLHNYFLPTLNLSMDRAAQSTTSLHPLSPALKQYKSLLKLTTRDATLRAKHRTEIEKALRDVERWVAEAMVAADGDLAWEMGGATADEAGEDAEEDGKERWALERLCDALLERGVLVPVSKKKRAPSKSAFHPPPSSLAIWTTLLAHLRLHHPTLPSILMSRIISHLLTDASTTSSAFDADADPDVRLDDPSYDLCLASWAMWLIDGSEQDAESAVRKDDAFVMLANGLGPRMDRASKARAGARSLFRALCASDPHLAELSSTILGDHDTAPPAPAAGLWSDDAMAIMDERLKIILATRTENSLDSITDNNHPEGDDGSTVAAPLTGSASLPSGWRLLNPASGWKPCPIGVYVGELV